MDVKACRREAIAFLVSHLKDLRRYLDKAGLNDERVHVSENLSPEDLEDGRRTTQVFVKELGSFPSSTHLLLQLRGWKPIVPDPEQFG